MTDDKTEAKTIGIAGGGFTLNQEAPSKLLMSMGDQAFKFYAEGGHLILAFHADGRIELAQGVEPDEAAQRFLEILSKAFPYWISSPDKSACKHEHGSYALSGKCVDCGASMASSDEIPNSPR